MNPSLKNISWDVDEPTYRADHALSYSTIARYAREGFNKLDSLFDKVDTPSLTFGKAVDALITGGQEEFDKEFMVADYTVPTDSVTKVVTVLFDEFSITHRTLQSVPDSEIIYRTEVLKYQLNWKPETRAKVIKEQGSEYYSLMYSAQGRTILDTETYSQIEAAVDALRTSEATKFFFSPNNPFNTRFVREYQLKFKSTLNDIDYRCMADLLLIDHESKIIYPVDLKTSYKPEWDFFKSFIEWRYDIQARLYWRIIRDNMNKDELFKEYKLADYKFIVVNRYTLTPLVWDFKDTQKKDTLYYGKDKNIELKDPECLGKEIYQYLLSRPKVPNGIRQNEYNDLVEWLYKL